jgi:hypothetical protein
MRLSLCIVMFIVDLGLLTLKTSNAGGVASEFGHPGAFRNPSTQWRKLLTGCSHIMRGPA